MAEKSKFRKFLSKFWDYLPDAKEKKIKNGKLTIRFRKPGENGFWIQFYKEF